MEYQGSIVCGHCSGEGYTVTCMDDLCRGSGCCIHDGKGNAMCKECEGYGSVLIDENGDTVKDY